MTLIEVNPDNKTAPQDRSCEAVILFMIYWGRPRRGHLPKTLYRENLQKNSIRKSSVNDIHRGLPQGGCYHKMKRFDEILCRNIEFLTEM